MALRPWIKNVLSFGAGYLFGSYRTQKRYEQPSNQWYAEISQSSLSDLGQQAEDLRAGLMLSASVAKEALRLILTPALQQEFSEALSEARRNYLRKPKEQSRREIVNSSISKWRMRGIELEEARPIMEEVFFPIWDEFIRGMGDDFLDLSMPSTIPSSASASVYEAADLVIRCAARITKRSIEEDPEDTPEISSLDFEMVLDRWRIEGRPETYTRTLQMMLYAFQYPGALRQSDNWTRTTWKPENVPQEWIDWSFFVVRDKNGGLPEEQTIINGPGSDEEKAKKLREFHANRVNQGT